jgi:hypothetical protein
MARIEVIRRSAFFCDQWPIGALLLKPYNDSWVAPKALSKIGFFLIITNSNAFLIASEHTMRPRRFLIRLALFVLFWQISFPPVALAVDWKGLFPFPSPNEIFDGYTADGQIFYLVGSSGTILKYDGAAFTVMDCPTSLPLYAIDGTGPSDIWAVGGDTATASKANRAVILHYDGTAWTRVQAPDSEGTTFPFSDVYAVSPTDAWAVMEDQNRIARWNGNTWSIMPTLPTFTDGFNKVCGVSHDAVWLVGDYNQIAFWNGSQFSDITLDPNQGYGDFTACWAVNNNTLFTGYNTGGLRKFDSQGNYERISHDQDIHTVSEITGTSENAVYFIGYGGFFVHYDGVTAKQAIPSDSWRRNVMLRTSDGDWIVGADRGVQRFSNGQMTSLTAPSAINTPDIHTIFWQNGLWIIPTWVHSESPIVVFHDGRRRLIYPPEGKTWVVIGANTLGENDIRIGVQDRTDSKNHIYQYTDGGWSEWIPPGYDRAMYDILRTPSGKLFAILGSIISSSPCLVADDGTDCFYGGDKIFTSMAACGETVYAVGEEGAIAIYRDGKWFAENSGTTNNLTAVACSDTEVYAVGEGRTAIWRSNGVWQPVNGLTPKDYFDFTDLTYDSTNGFVASLKAPQGTQWTSFLYSFDSGNATMDKGWIGPNVNIQAVASDGTTSYAAGYPGVLMYAGTPLEYDPSLPDEGLFFLEDAITIMRLLAGQSPDIDVSKYSKIYNNEKIGLPECIYILKYISY